MRLMRYIFLLNITALLCLAPAGCAPRQKQQSLKKTLQKLEEMAQQMEEMQQDIQEIDSRQFILDDKVDTLKVQQESKSQPKHHPVIRITPGLKPSSSQDDDVLVERKVESSAKRASIGGRSMVDDSEVEYVGEAKEKYFHPHQL